MARTKKEKTAPTGEPVVLDTQTRDLIQEWKNLKEWLAKGEAREMELRQLFVERFFPSAVEGTNRRTGPGVEIKMTKVVNRRIRIETLNAVMSELYKLSPQYCDARTPQSILKWVPEFSTSILKELPEQSRKVFEQTLEIKDGSPQLEIVISEAPPIQVEFGQSNAGTSQAFTPDPNATVVDLPSAFTPAPVTGKPPLPKNDGAPVPAGASASGKAPTQTGNAASPSKKGGAGKKSATSKRGASKPPVKKKATGKKK